MENDFGLELTNNSKVGWAFSLSRSESCIDATDICKRLCYGNSIRYRSAGQRNKRIRNFRTAEFLLRAGGPQLLAENLGLLVEQARPRDWFTAKVLGSKTELPWTLRIHDVGDFYSVEYVEAWKSVIESYPECSFWFYTRSFGESEMLAALSKLAEHKNCKGWLSADSENYSQAIMAMCKSGPSVWNLALLQDADLQPSIATELVAASQAGDIVNFPYHRNGHHVMPTKHRGLTVCPAVLGAYKLSSSKEMLRPCQSCAFCLP